MANMRTYREEHPDSVPLSDCTEVVSPCMGEGISMLPGTNKDTRDGRKNWNEGNHYALHQSELWKLTLEIYRLPNPVMAASQCMYRIERQYDDSPLELVGSAVVNV